MGIGGGGDGGVGIEAEDFWGDHTVLRGNRWGGDQSSPAVYKGGLYKIDCQITTNKGGRGGCGGIRYFNPDTTKIF